MERKADKLLQGIDTVIVRVSSIEVSKAWYLDKLGLRSTWDDTNRKLVVLDTGSPTSLTLWQTDQPITVNRETASYPIFRTPDAAALRQELQNKGIDAGEVIQDEPVQYFFFYDPDGNVLEACQVNE
jgi:catechol 2,3-dioxygenase-like lactoylglutathione lyase family enzyme